MFRESLDDFYRDFGIPVEIKMAKGVVHCRGILDIEYLPMLANRYDPVPVNAVEGRHVSLRVISSYINGIRHGDRVLANGRLWIVSSVEPAEDGANTDLGLKEVEV